MLSNYRTTHDGMTGQIPAPLLMKRAEHPSLQPDHTMDDREVRKSDAAEKQKAKDVNR